MESDTRIFNLPVKKKTFLPAFKTEFKLKTATFKEKSVKNFKEKAEAYDSKCFRLEDKEDLLMENNSFHYGATSEKKTSQLRFDSGLTKLNENLSFVPLLPLFTLEKQGKMVRDYIKRTYIVQNCSLEKMIMTRLNHNFTIKIDTYSGNQKKLKNAVKVELSDSASKHTLLRINDSVVDLNLETSALNPFLISEDNKFNEDEVEIEFVKLSPSYGVFSRCSSKIKASNLTPDQWEQFDESLSANFSHTQLFSKKKEFFFVRVGGISTRKTTTSSFYRTSKREGSESFVSSSSVKLSFMDSMLNIIKGFKYTKIAETEGVEKYKLVFEGNTLEINIENVDENDYLVLTYCWGDCSNYWIDMVHSKFETNARSFDISVFDSDLIFNKNEMQHCFNSHKITEAQFDSEFGHISIKIEFKGEIVWFIRETDIFCILQSSGLFYTKRATYSSYMGEESKDCLAEIWKLTIK